MAETLSSKHRLVPASQLAKQAGDSATSAFDTALMAAAQAPLVEIAPAEAADHPAALGFALAWISARAQSQNGLLVWSVPEHCFSEYGAPYAEGLAQFGIDPHQLLIVRARTQTDALWAAEQALSVPCAQVLCSIAPGGKSLALAASRRLLLNAEKNDARGILLRFDPLNPSAARSRWRIRSAPSHADDHGFNDRELGPPAFNVQLERNRASPAGQTWRVDWFAHEKKFRERPFSRCHASNDAPDTEQPLDGALFAAPRNRPGTLYHYRAG